jgi:hypothetical protein
VSFPQFSVDKLHPQNDRAPEKAVKEDSSREAPAIARFLGCPGSAVPYTFLRNRIRDRRLKFIREDADTVDETAKRTDKHSSSTNDGGAVGKAVATPIDGKDGVDICASAVGSGFDGDQQRSTGGRSGASG